ncbi:hypothetical protein [Niabella drilacis]|uniref:Uncharacterized protein n=1 Tax=Niabella drilacis (strain DSM 25811 / CCM 8410 / CCUG 62505 / LMG 26954 / E90) TaxID=1285928 RepID=A0A1G6S0M9_NIADE|nr:hypothetical protein [Niabella drilacis]SDD10472.1 hypothetical protein SAMN04487894_10641 [Niabella drilacis]
MAYNILAYTIYAVITIYIIYWVGRSFHKNGRIFILRLFRYQAGQADATNNIILIAYYLFNTGYAIIQFSNWQAVTSAQALIASIAGKTGMLVGILAVTHYFNMALIYFLSKRIHYYSS